MPPSPSSQELAVHDDVFDLMKRIASFMYQQTTESVKKFFRRFDRKRKSVIVNKLHESASFDHRDLSEYDEHAEEDAPLVPPDADDGSEQVRLTDASRQ